MAIYHMQPSEIARLEWDELAWYHEQAIDFYRNDRELMLKAMGAPMAALFGGS